MKNLVTKLLAAFVFSITALFTTACGEDKSYEDTALSYVKAIYKADSKTVVKLMLFKDKRAEKEQHEMAEMKLNQMLPALVKEIENKAGGVDSITVEKSELNEAKDSATVTVKITYKKKFNNKDSENMPVYLVKIDDTWKVLPKSL